MIYNETYVALATTVDQLVDIIITHGSPGSATIEVAEGERAPDVEVWYDTDTNTVILK